MPVLGREILAVIEQNIINNACDLLGRSRRFRPFTESCHGLTGAGRQRCFVVNFGVGPTFR